MTHSIHDAHVFVSDHHQPGEQAIVVPCYSVVHQGIIGITVHWPNKYVVNYIDREYYGQQPKHYDTHFIDSCGWTNTSYWRHNRDPSYTLCHHFIYLNSLF